MSAHPARELLAGWPVVIDIPVAWGEMDAFGHVNNVVYFRYFESARIAYFETVGYTDLMRASGLGPILADTRCRFRAPLHYPDQLAAGARIATLGPDRFEMEYSVASERLGRIAAEGGGLIVSYDYNAGARVTLPAPVRAAIERLQPSLLQED